MTIWRADTDFVNLAKGTVLTIHTRHIAGGAKSPFSAGDAINIFNARSERTQARIVNADSASITIELPMLVRLIATPKNETDHVFGGVHTEAIPSQVWIVRAIETAPSPRAAGNAGT